MVIELPKKRDKQALFKKINLIFCRFSTMVENINTPGGAGDGGHCALNCRRSADLIANDTKIDALLFKRC